ncbi:acyl carrier protein [Bradyrhizobium sp. STM 3562]|uniref:acyl carrier protein n=1 Tax=Bradyrhizobium sp. STM 3562 TaxID=578924 RepID=UPI00388F60FC
MDINDRTFDAVKAVLVKTLGIEDRAGTLNRSTALFGSMPELDSFAVLELLTSLEEQFGFEIDGSEFTGDILETVGSLTDFVATKTTLHRDAPLLAG